MVANSRDPTTRRYISMTLRTKVLLLVLVAGAASLGALFAQAQKKPAIAYPTDFRKWRHVKTMVIYSKENKLFDRFGGLHNIYVNDTGWPSLQRSKAYADGSMYALELFDTRTSLGAIEARGGARKSVVVMKKDKKLYPNTGGWGFEVFQGYEVKGSLKDMKECFNCHASQKTRDYIWSDYVE
jgi:hypothetical protein